MFTLISRESVPDWVWVSDQGGYRLIDGGSRRDRHEWLELECAESAAK